MKIYLIAALILILSINLSHAESMWGLNSETESRLTAALNLQKAAKRSLQNKVGVSFVTVGDDSTCDFRVGTNKIQNAIDSGASEIRIASNTVYEENVVINDPTINLSLRGGFADCAQAELNNQSDLADDWTEITRVNGQGGSVFFITGLIQGNITSFENLKIIGGDGQGNTGGGGIRLELTDSDAVIENVWLTQGQNMATGGGLSVISSKSRVILKNTDIFQNQTIGPGGGIYCNNFTASFKPATIVITETSHLYNNTSGNIGGGAFISKDCLLSSFSGSSVVNAGKGIFNNSANDDGGGVYAINGGSVLIYGGMLCDLNNECFGDESNPASVYGNQADTDASGFESGGGLYASGMGTGITIIAGHLYENTNDNGIGGAIALFDNAQLTINHPRKNNFAVSCWNSDRCNLFNANSASSGGVIYASSNSQVRIEHAYFEDNRANSAVVISSSGNAVTQIFSSVFNNNGNSGVGGFLDNSIIEVIDNADTQIKYSTFADNNYQNEVFHVTGIATNFSLNSSIVHDSNGGNVMNNFTGAASVNCVIAHEITTLPGTNNSLDDPEFVDRMNRNYHLNSSNSPAIDYCDFLAGAVEDIDYQNHGFDNINLSNFLGTYDLGADEAFPQNFVTIGGGANCDFNTATHNIQDAIQTGIQEIRLANTGTYNLPVNIDDINLIIRGGYANCDDALNGMLSVTNTLLSGNIGPVESIITIQGNTLRNLVTLENLVLIGSDNSAISAIGANVEVTINNATIALNTLATGFSGGAIFTSGGNTDFTLNDTIITLNRASNGGGIYCSGDQISVKLIGDSSISDNIASGKGGGIYAVNGCEFTVYSGTVDTAYGGEFKGIQRNKAAEQGGGIYVELGAKVVLYGHEFCDANNTCFGDNTNPVNVNDNLSDSDSSGGERGGGIYLTGVNTTVEIYAGLIQRNISPNGAGIYVNDNASLTVARLSKDCWDMVKCNYFHNNRSITTGGAIQSDQGHLDISSTYFEGNKASSGSALYAFGGLSTARIEGSVFNHNASTSLIGSAYVIRAASSAKVEVIHSTFADNTVGNKAVFGIALNSELKLFSSIVHETNGAVLDINPGTTTIDCVMAHETSSFTGSNIFLQDPNFADRNNRDYHLNPNSLAIDVCDNSLAGFQFKDIDFDDRGFDDTNISNINGPYDIGADESLLKTDFMFADGFE